MARSDTMGLHTVFVDNKPSSRTLRKARLKVTEGPDQGQTFILDKPKMFVGRAAVNHIQLQDQSVSSTHFELRAEEEGILLKDMGSTNGTHLGGCRVREVWLTPGATFRAGNTTFEVRAAKDSVEIPLSTEDHFAGVIGGSVAMREVFAVLEKVAPSDLSCLIEGETGTGKERVAHAIHQKSRRRTKPYVVLDCSSIPRDLMESYVFGHEKGAFTGAIGQRTGAFEQADGGTLFLDEIGELPLDLQPKLLRVLDNRQFKRVGGSKTIHVDCRVLAATNRDLRAMVNEGSFREDLYFRLSIVNLQLPSLSKRRADIPLLVNHFLQDLKATRHDLSEIRLAADAMDHLLRHDWPGNVRELKNVITRAASLSSSPLITRQDLHLHTSQNHPSSLLPPPSSPPNPHLVAMPPVDLNVPFKDAKQEVIDLFESHYLHDLIHAHQGNISKASREAGLTRYHLRELLKRHNLQP